MLLRNDREIPKYAIHLVYITNSTRADKVEEDIMRSIYYNQPKRADVYWLLHVEVTDEPNTSALELKPLNQMK